MERAVWSRQIWHQHAENEEDPYNDHLFDTVDDCQAVCACKSDSNNSMKPHMTRQVDFDLASAENEKTCHSVA